MNKDDNDKLNGSTFIEKDLKEIINSYIIMFSYIHFPIY
jgi:hypothetical protein